MSLIDDYPEPHPRMPECPCCGGTGMHVYKPYVYSSPHDDDEECSICGGSGRSWFDARQNSCTGHWTLMRRFR